MGTADINIMIENVQAWAHDRNLIFGSYPKSQLLKTMSEVGELADAINKNHTEGVKDGIGDVLVTLIILAEMKGLTLSDCLAHAYDEIKDRKGVMFNGVFIKATDELYDFARASVKQGPKLHTGSAVLVGKRCESVLERSAHYLYPAVALFAIVTIIWALLELLGI